MANPLMAFLLGAFVPSPSYGELVGVTRRQTRYSQALPSQVAHAAAATPWAGLRRSLTGQTGGEDWPSEEPGALLAPPAASAGLQHVTNGLARSAPMPASWYSPNLPTSNAYGGQAVEGAGTGYQTGAYDKGWVDLRAAGGTSWGASAGYGAARPNVQAATLLEPTFKTPAPRAMAADYQDTNKGHTRLSDMFGD